MFKVEHLSAFFDRGSAVEEPSCNNEARRRRHLRPKPARYVNITSGLVVRLYFRFLSGLCVKADAASDLICLLESVLGARMPCDAILPTLLPVFSFFAMDFTSFRSSIAGAFRGQGRRSSRGRVSGAFASQAATGPETAKPMAAAALKGIDIITKVAITLGKRHCCSIRMPGCSNRYKTSQDDWQHDLADEIQGIEREDQEDAH
jgi:hypothetical protein